MKHHLHFTDVETGALLAPPRSHHGHTTETPHWLRENSSPPAVKPGVGSAGTSASRHCVIRLTRLPSCQAECVPKYFSPTLSPPRLPPAWKTFSVQSASCGPCCLLKPPPPSQRHFHFPVPLSLNWKRLPGARCSTALSAACILSCPDTASCSLTEAGVCSFFLQRRPMLGSPLTFSGKPLSGNPTPQHPYPSTMENPSSAATGCRGYLFANTMMIRSGFWRQTHLRFESHPQSGQVSHSSPPPPTAALCFSSVT